MVQIKEVQENSSFFFSQNTLLLKSICAICGGLTCEKERKPMKYSYLKFIWTNLQRDFRWV